ncbi:MAG TPA: 50S ribosomal protein L21 [Pleomorphomonadaceae bacterium]|nr:50S ribosomal protein L21 [Pleomorphomonadaceae bacterium]
MYAVVDNGGKQYRVEPGRTLVIDRLDAEAGATVTFDRVLLVGDEDGVTVGTPTVSGASVRGTVLEHGRGPKIIVFRFRPKAHYRRRTGHRSELTRVRIDEIATAETASKPASKAAAPRRTAAKTAAKAAPKAAAASKTAGPRKAAASRKKKSETK